MNKEDKEFLENNRNTPTYSQIQNMIKTGKISKERAVELIKTREKVDKLQADLDYEKVRNKEIALGTIDIATAAIPVGGGAKVTGKLVSKLAPKTGKKIAQSMVRGTIDGAKTGAVHGALTGAVDEDKNPVTQAAKEATTGAAFGASVAYGAGKAWQKAEGAALKKIEDIKTLRKTETKYYKGYVIGRTVEHEKLGKIDFTNAGLETVSRHPQAGRNYDTVVTDVKNAQYSHEKSLYHPRKDKVKKFHTLKNDTQEFKIAEDNNGHKKYYMSKLKSGTNNQSTQTGSAPLSRLKGDPEDRPSRVGAVSPNNIITRFFKKNNPVYNETFQQTTENTLIKSATVETPKLVDQNETYEPARVGNVAADMDNIRIDGKKWSDLEDEQKEAFLEGFDTGEFAKKGEKQNKPKENNWTSKFNIGNPNTDKGHWITLDNGKHIFVKDK